MEESNGVGLFRHDKYKDITDEFWSDCQKLAPGQLVKEDGFTLLDGVHALEIWDKRMDTGVIFEPLATELAAVAQSVSIDDSTINSVLDLLLAREMAWHRGSMLSQTLLSCVYVEDLIQQFTAVERQTGAATRKEADLNALLDFEINDWNTVLRAYILATVKCVNMATAIMDPDINQAIYPEEDIVVNTFGLSTLQSISADRVIRIVERAIKWVNSSSSSPSVAETVARLKLRCEWLQVLHQKIPTKIYHLDEALRHIRGIIQRESLPEEPVSTKVTIVEEQDRQGIELIFSQKVQSRVSNASPLRPLTTVSKASAYTQLRVFFESINDLRELRLITHSSNLLSYFLSFSQKNALPYIRALLKLNVSDTLVMSCPVRDWVVKDIVETVGFSELIKLAQPSSSSSGGGIDSNIDMFLKNAQLCYVDLLSVMCHNRSRQRQNLAHCIVSWDSLQVHAEELDTHLANARGLSDVSVTSWVFVRKLQILTWVVLLGFELDLYKPWEFGYMYFYLHYLLSNMIMHLTEIRTGLESANMRDASAYIRSLELESRALDQITQGSMHLCTYLDPPLPPGIRNTTTPELLYGLRMKPFSSIGVPDLPTYKDVHEQLHKLTGDMTLQYARNVLDSAKKALTTLEDLSTKSTYVDLLKRSCIGLGIQIAMAKTKAPQSSVKIVKEGYHPYFPVLTLVKK